MALTTAQKERIAHLEQQMASGMARDWRNISRTAQTWYAQFIAEPDTDEIAIPDLGITIYVPEYDSGHSSPSAQAHHRWPAYAYLDDAYAHAGRPRHPLYFWAADRTSMHVLTARKEWDAALLAWAQRQADKHTQGMRALAWLVRQRDIVLGNEPGDWGEPAAGTPPELHAVESRYRYWQGTVLRWTRSQSALTSALHGQTAWTGAEGVGLDEYRQVGAEKVTAAATARRAHLLGATSAQGDMLGGSCPAQATALQTLSSARQLGLVKLARATSAAAVDTVVAERTGVINAVGVTGSPTWQNASGESLALTAGTWPVQFRWASGGTGRQLVTTVLAASPEPLQLTAIERVEATGDGALEVDLSVPTGSDKKHRADVYWVKGGDVGADTYRVALTARNDCGPDTLTISITQTPASAD